MPTNRTKRARSRTNSIDHWKLDQLFMGTALIAGVGYAADIPNGCNSWTDDQRDAFREAMRADWERHGPDVLAWWRGEHDRYTWPYGPVVNKRNDLREYLARHGETMPYAAREFGEPA